MPHDLHSDLFRIRRETTPEGITVFTLATDIDFTTAPQLEQTITAPGRLPCTVIDFSQVQFMDSSGINALVRAHRHG
jgi:anti-sigma B factor antagonist